MTTPERPYTTDKWRAEGVEDLVFVLPAMPPPHWFHYLRLNPERYEHKLADLVVLLPVIEATTRLPTSPEQSAAAMAILSAIAQDEVWLWATCAWVANTVTPVLPPLQARERHMVAPPGSWVDWPDLEQRSAAEMAALASRMITAVARGQWPERFRDNLPNCHVLLLTVLIDTLRYIRMGLHPQIHTIPSDPDFEGKLELWARKAALPQPEEGPTPCGGCGVPTGQCTCQPGDDGTYPCRFCGVPGARCAIRRAGREMFGECCGLCEVVHDFSGRYAAHEPRAALDTLEPAPEPS